MFSSGMKTSEDREERLPFRELPYPLDMDSSRFIAWCPESPWLNADDLSLGRGDPCLIKGGVIDLAGTEIDRLVFFSELEGSASSGIGASLNCDVEFRFGFLLTDL